MAYSFLTASEIITAAKSEAISATTSQITAIQDPQMVEFLHQLNSEFCFAAEGRSHQKGWSFLKKPGNFNTHVHNSLSVAAVVGDSSISLNSSALFQPSGRVAIETFRGGLDIVDYSSNVANVLTVDTDGEAIGIAHATDRVYELYAVPSDFARVHRLWINSRPFIEKQLTGQFPLGGTYALYGDFFFMPRGMYTADATLLYEKKPNTISELDSETNIPRIFQRWAIEMTLFRLFRIRRKRGDLQTTLELAQIELEKALNYDMVNHSSNHITLA